MLDYDSFIGGFMLDFILASDGTVSDWVAKTFPIVRTVLICLLAVFAIALIVLVFMQINGGDDTTNAITGNKDSYYAQNKSESREGRITKWVYICVGVIALLCILYFLSFIPYKG